MRGDGTLSFGEIIKNERKEAKLTQVELAKKSGISRTYLSDVENNRYKPSVEMIKKISQTISESKDVAVEGIFSKIMNASGYSIEDEEFKVYCEKLFSVAKEKLTDRFVEENGAEYVNMIPLGIPQKTFEIAYSFVKHNNLSYEDKDEILQIFTESLFQKIFGKDSGHSTEGIYHSFIRRIEHLRSINYKYFYRPKSLKEIGEMQLKDGLDEKDFYYIQSKLDELINTFEKQLKNIN